MTSSSKKLKPLHKDLLRRYLTWAYKSTKESFDRLERKTTQLMADDYILKDLLKNKETEAGYLAEVENFKAYIAKKRDTPIDDGKYIYFKNRLKVVEKAITHFLGAKELKSIQAAYEQEFTRRIWESKDH
jgi:hypothetical protein